MCIILHIYGLPFRVWLEMLQKNLKGCKKEIKSLSVIENAVSNCDVTCYLVT